MNKRLLFVGNTSWSMWNFRGDLMRALKAMGYDVFVAAPADRYVEELQNNFKFVPLRVLSRRSLNPFLDLRLAFELFILYRKINPAVVFQFTIKPNIYGSISAFLAGKRSVAVVTGLGYVFIRRNILTWLVSLLYKIAFYFPDKIFFLNNEDREDFIKQRIIGKSSSKALVVSGEGINVTYFSPRKVESTGEKIFLFVGRLLKDKGIREFIRAASQIRSEVTGAKFQILGAIDQSNPASITPFELSEWVESGVVEYLGEQNDVRPHIARASVVTLPSYMEGMSRVLMEACAMGKPIIASNIRGCREFVSEGRNGYLVRARNHEDLSAAFRRFCELQSAEVQAFGEHSRRLALENFSYEKVTEFYSNYLEKVVPI